MERRGFSATTGHAQAVLVLLEQQDLAAEPLNYALWYAYVSGREPLLNQAIDSILSERGRVTPEDMVILHQAFLGGAPFILREPADIEATANAASEELVAVALDEAAAATRGLASARDAVAGFALRQATPDLVARLIAATRIIEQGKRRIEAELAKSRAELDALQADLDHVRHESLNDQLTTLASRKHFDQALEGAVAEARATAKPLSLLFTDIDHFKSFNDRYGHQTGDHVLRLVALAVKQNIRGQDTACRYGGEEFAIILPRTSVEQATAIGEAIREAVMTRELRQRATGEPLRRVTISIGIASYRTGDTPQTMIGRADDCLYGAKSGGRNLVVSEADPRRIVA